MKTDPSNLSIKDISMLVLYYEGLMSKQQADLDDYEVYVQCQRELARRQVQNATPRDHKIQSLWTSYSGR